MKLKTIIVAIMLITLGSCNDFLNLSPENAVTPDNFFQSESDFQQAVDGVYAPLQDLYDSPTSWAMGEMRSDNTHYFYNVDYRQPFPEEIADFINGSENTVSDDRYYINFDIIARANQVLAVIDNADFDPSSKDRFKGEVLFLRALAYFDLVRYYGGVPLHLEPAKDLETASLNRSSPEEVYNQIITDATTAANLLPGKTDQDAGRATSGAALTLLGDVYLTLGEWTLAENALMNVSGYSLLDNYSDIFDPTNKNNAESIFEIQYLENTSLGLHSYFPYYFIPLTDQHSDLTLGPTGAQSAPLSGWNIPTGDLIEVYEENDERFEASIAFHTGPSLISDTSYVNLPYIKKYQHPHSIFGQTNQNFPIYRYAEVLLMLAETLNEQGRLSEAQQLLNQVRNRASLDNYNALGQEDLREAILRERRVELAFENKRWLDLVRTGKAVEVMNEYGAKLKSNPAYYYLSESSYDVDQNDLVFPIPFLEIQVNPDLQQNPGY
jgi:hypothetical protein